jgi:hypothetical protein
MQFFGSNVLLRKDITSPWAVFKKWNPHAFRAASAAPVAN